MAKDKGHALLQSLVGKDAAQTAVMLEISLADATSRSEVLPCLSQYLARCTAGEFPDLDRWIPEQ